MIFAALRDALRADAPVALATVVEGPHPGAKLLVRPGQEPLGSLGDAELDRVVARDAQGELEAGLTGTRHYGLHGEARQREVSVFIESFALPPRMIIFGAVDFTAALAKVAKVLGYRVTVVDARKVFANQERFPEADEVVVQWPNEFLETAPISRRTAIVILTHDPKFDIPILEFALKSPVGYLGAMGSRRTHEKRKANLREIGVTDEQMERIHAPLGLDLGARTPEETAVSIMAQIIAMRTGRSGGHLDEASGRIHA